MRTERLLPLALLFSFLIAATALAERPNIVVVFVDDMGWGDFSCFGGEAVETENVDRLADEGIRFTNFYVNAPICSPSRCAITTGQYPQRWRITSYLAADPGQTKNLAARNPELTTRLAERLNAWNAQLPPDDGQTPDVAPPVAADHFVNPI